MVKTRDITQIAIFTAIIAVVSPWKIPIPFSPVPITFSLLAIFTAALYLGAKRATIATTCYIVLGGIGVPIFAGFQGGFGVLTGQTGGYIVGYIFLAATVGYAGKVFKNKILLLAILSTILLAIFYVFGTVWFVVIFGYNKISIYTALTYCVFPFIIGDVIKIIVAIYTVRELPKFDN